MNQTEKEIYQKNWEELAIHLTLNHCSASTREMSSSDAPDLSYKEIWLNYLEAENEKLTNQKKEDLEQYKKCRNVFVIGSGASTAVNKALFPLGNNAVDVILEKFGYEEICNAKDKTFTENELDSANNENEDKKDISEDVERLQNQIKKDKILKWKKAKRLRSRMVLRAKNDDQTFETKLSLLSHFVPVSEVRNAISQLFGYRTYPNLFYEILSYLLKNRFIDGIINFNFDELLDEVIDEEVGLGQLLKIVSDGDVPQYSNILQNQRLKVPFYIKPHGTFSSKSSLRFTKEHYLDIPDEIESFLGDLFKGKESGSNKQLGSQFDTLNIVVIGFKLESLEFNNVISEAFEELPKENNINIFYVEYRQEMSEDRKAELVRLGVMEEDDELRLVSHKQKEKAILTRIFGVNRPELKNKNFNVKVLDLEALKVNNLNNFIEGTYHKIIEHFEIYKPKYISRQLTLIDFFNSKIEELNNEFGTYMEEFAKRDKDFEEYNILKDKIFFHSTDYFLERTIFEILLTTFKNNGFIQLLESLKKVNRVGKYYHLYYEKNEKNNEIHKKNKEFDKLKTTYTIHDILFELAFEGDKSSYNFDVYKISLTGKFKKSIQLLIEKIKKQPHHFPKLRKITLKCLERFERAYLKEVDASALRSQNSESINIDEDKYKVLGDRLMNTVSINLYPNFTDYQLNYFGKIESKHIVPTYTSLKREINKMLNQEGQKTWSHLFIVIDKAEYLNRVKFDNKNVHIIEADFDQALTKRECTTSSTLPYFDHHRHMYIFMDRIDNSLEPVKAIYYYKKGFSNNVNAISIDPDTPNNFRFLMRTFIGYYVKSMNYTKCKEKDHINQERQIPIIDSHKSLEKHLNKLDEDDRYKNLFIEYLKNNANIIYQ